MKRIILYISFIFFSFIFSEIGAKKIASGFDKPIYICSFPNHDNYHIVLEQKGTIKIIKNNQILRTYFLDIRDRVHRPLFPGDEMGLLGFAFDPYYIENNYIYVHYNDKEDNTIISRFEVDDGIANKSSEKNILKLKQPYMNHNGGTISFGKDGYLYIGLGDGGSAGDPEKRAQDLTNLFGSILRIDVHTSDSYLIPKDNPFIDNNNIKSEIWSYGLRNPWRFSFDRLTGDMIIGDVGQSLWEEINFELFPNKGGKNYGWNVMEGNHCYPEDSKCNSDNLTMPVFEYPNNANYAKTLFGIKQPNMDGCSITGGYVYRGNELVDMDGRYIFGDYCTGKIWSIVVNENESINLKNHTDSIMNSIGKKEFYLSSFGEDNKGEIFIIDYNGTIYKLVNI